MTKISRDALNRKLVSVILPIEKRKADDRRAQQETEDLMTLRSQLHSSIEDLSQNETLSKLGSRGKLIQSLHNAYADTEYELNALSAPPTQSYEQVVTSAVDAYLEAIEIYRKGGGEYYDGSVRYTPDGDEQAAALKRIVEKVEKSGHPVKVLDEPQRIPHDQLKSYSERNYTPLNFVTSLAGVDAFEAEVKAEGMSVQGPHIDCKRMILDFSGQLWPTDQVNVDTGEENAVEASRIDFENRAFVISQGASWQLPWDHLPKDRKFLTMALTGSPNSINNQLFYMYQSNNEEGVTTPGTLAKSVAAKLEYEGQKNSPHQLN